MSETEELPDEPASYDQRRSRRKRPVRARSIAMDRVPKRELEAARRAHVPADDVRPVTRGDCASVPRPCVWVSCPHNLYLDVDPATGSLKLNFPDLEPGEMTESCALDVAGRDGVTLEDVAGALNLTRERIRQLEERALSRIKRRIAHLADDAPERAPRPLRSLPLLLPPAPLPAPLAPERPLLPHPPEEHPTMPKPESVTPALLRQLLAYLASIETGARSESVHGWLRDRGIRRGDAEELLEDLVNEGRLEQHERAAAGGTVIVRYRVADPSVRPAPLPVSSAPAAELAAAPAEAPEELAPVALEELPSVSPAGILDVPFRPDPALWQEAAAEPTPEASPTPGQVELPPSRPTEPEPLEEPAPVAPTSEPGRNVSVTPEASPEPEELTPASRPAPLADAPTPTEPQEEPPSAPRPVAPVHLVTRARPAPEQLQALLAVDALWGLPLEQLERIVARRQEARALDQEEAGLHRVLDEMERNRQACTEKLGQVDRRRHALRLQLERELLEGATPAPVTAASVEELVPDPIPMGPPLPAKASSPVIGPAQWLADKEESRELRTHERVLLAIKPGAQVRAADLEVEGMDMHNISTAMARLAGIGQLERVDRGVYKVTAQGQREQKALSTQQRRAS